MSISKKSAPILLMLGLFAMAFLLLPSATAADNSKTKMDSEEVTKLLGEVQTEAVELKMDAEKMESYTINKLSWESHAHAVQQIREHVNATGRLLTRLNENRALASPWQEQAIDEITPLLRELAANTTAVIEHLDANKTRLHSAEYKEYLTANYEVSKELSALITDFVDYAKHKNRFEHLTNKLEIERK